MIVNDVLYVIVQRFNESGIHEKWQHFIRKSCPARQFREVVSTTFMEEAFIF